MLANDIIEPSQSEWSSPIIMAKRNGKYRFCLDFRKVNSVTKKDAYPLPFMSSILDRLRSARYISTLDITKAFHHILLTPESRPITAFAIPGALYQFKKLPFGLTNAPASFQRLIDKIITPDMAPFVFAYLDDVIIVTEDFNSHLKWLKLVIDKLLAAGLVLNMDKSEFCRSEVKYLGYIVNREGLKVDQDKIAPILNYRAPRTVKQVKRLLGMANWYQKFIPQFSAMMSPISKLLKKNVKWVWGPEQQAAFDSLKDKLTSSPLLVRPDLTRPFIIHTDASSIGLGAMLTQVTDGEEHVIAYASRTLSDAEKNYPATELEILAVLWAVEKKFRPYVEGQEITVISDHSSLRWLQNLQNPSGKLARWAMRLLAHNIRIIHRKGSEHCVPDSLSRMYESELVSVNALKENKDEWYERKVKQVIKEPRKYYNWKLVGNQLFFRSTTRTILFLTWPDLNVFTEHPS